MQTEGIKLLSPCDAEERELEQRHPERQSQRKHTAYAGQGGRNQRYLVQEISC